MPGKLGFVFPKEALAPVGGAVAERGEDALRGAGVRFAFSEQPDEYRYSRMGGWPVSFRASIVRTICFKMVGTGIAALLMSVGSLSGRYTSFSCALCAAVNAIAAVHYALIWQIREQNMLPQKWRARMGRAPEEEAALLRDERKHDRVAMFIQENATDGLRSEAA